MFDYIQRQDKVLARTFDDPRRSRAEMNALRAGTLAIVPRGCWHRNDALNGVTVLFVIPWDGNAHSWDDPRGS